MAEDNGKAGQRQGRDGDVVLLNNKFSLKFPPEWEDHSYYRFDGPIEDGVKHSIIVTIENNVEVPDLVQYAELNIRAMEGGLQGYTELKRGPVVLESRIPAYELVYKWMPVKERLIYQRVVYVLINQTGYILTASFSKKTWKMLGTMVDRILMSFKAA